MSKRASQKAVVLLSGGLDSATTLYYAMRRGYKTYALIFEYGQRHKKEVKKAVQLARKSRSEFICVRIPLPWKGSALLDKAIKLPKNRRIIPREIPATYVPARNIIFISFAASYAEALGAKAIFIGANAIDYSGYPDCRPSFYRAFQTTLHRGLKTGVQGRPVKILTPLVKKTKAQIIRLGQKLKVPYDLTWSCYSGTKTPCGKCDSCLIRSKGFKGAGMEDPLISAVKSRA